MPRISEQAGHEAARRFAPWFRRELRQRARTAGAVSYAARKADDGFELKSWEVTAYTTGATGPTAARVIQLARLLGLDVTDALWHSHPAHVLGLAEMLADAGGNPFRLWSVQPRSDKDRSGAAVETPAA